MFHKMGAPKRWLFLTALVLAFPFQSSASEFSYDSAHGPFIDGIWQDPKFNCDLNKSNYRFQDGKREQCFTGPQGFGCRTLPSNVYRKISANLYGWNLRNGLEARLKVIEPGKRVEIAEIVIADRDKAQEWTRTFGGIQPYIEKFWGGTKGFELCQAGAQEANASDSSSPLFNGVWQSTNDPECNRSSMHMIWLNGRSRFCSRSSPTSLEECSPWERDNLTKKVGDNLFETNNGPLRYMSHFDRSRAAVIYDDVKIMDRSEALKAFGSPEKLSAYISSTLTTPFRYCSADWAVRRILAETAGDKSWNRTEIQTAYSNCKKAIFDDYHFLSMGNPSLYSVRINNQPINELPTFHSGSLMFSLSYTIDLPPSVRRILEPRDRISNATFFCSIEYDRPIVETLDGPHGAHTFPRTR